MMQVQSVAAWGARGARGGFEVRRLSRRGCGPVSLYMCALSICALYAYACGALERRLASGGLPVPPPTTPPGPLEPENGPRERTVRNPIPAFFGALGFRRRRLV